MRRFAPLFAAYVQHGILVVAVAGCGRTDPAPSAAATTEPPPAPVAARPDPIAKGIPHGGMISEVAVTEEADAALTFDTLRGVRLWPTLDGTRPPVPVSADAPHALALAHTGKDLLAAILDDAGGVRVVRLGLDGTVRGRASLPGLYEQAIALSEGVLVRTKDHAVEWYAPDGTPKGRVMADPAQQVFTLVARRGRAAALVGNAERGHGDVMRWLGLGTQLAWGDSVEIPIDVKGEMFALSPSGRRVALLDQGEQVHVFDLANIRPVEIHGATVRNPQANTIGFIDDGEVVISAPSGPVVNVWRPDTSPAPSDPWAVAGSGTALPMPRMSHFVDGLAIGDGLVVSGYGAALALSTTSSVRYLGWKALGTGNLVPAGTQFTLVSNGTHFVWLDEQLRARGDLELRPNNQGPWIYAYPIDEDHIVTQTPASGHKYDVELVEIARSSTDPWKARRRALLGQYESVERVEFSPDSGLLAVGRRGKIDRFRLDLEHTTATRESPVRVKGSPTHIHLLDPAKADGVVAITIGWESDWDNETRLSIYREGAHGKITKQRIAPFSDVLAIDPTGTMYILVYGTPNEIRVQKGKEVLSKFALPELTAPIAIAEDGSRIAYVAKGEIVMLDRAGKQLWREPLWGAAQLMFTRDSRKLLVRAVGGIVALDGATGVRTAMECGWDFGVLTDAPPVTVSASQPVCEDPTLQ